MRWESIISFPDLLWTKPKRSGNEIRESNLVSRMRLLTADAGHLLIFPFIPILSYRKRERGSDISRLMFIKHSISDIKIIVA